MILKKGIDIMLENRFLEYLKIDTQSCSDSQSAPSSTKQLDLANLLVSQLHELNVTNACVDEYGIVYGRIPGNGGSQDVIGFIAHMDTSPDASGADVNPRIIRNYQGETIQLNSERSLDPEEFETLTKVIGEDIVVTDGTTLLGADDKAGIAIIMEMVSYLNDNPQIIHNDIQIAFTPDEEVGRGTKHFDLEKFNARYAYTIDGGFINEISYENFNAYSAQVAITGKSVHPGSAKNKMVSATMIAIEFETMLPLHKRPYFTSEYEGFNHLTKIDGTVEQATMEYILRNHSIDKLNEQIGEFNKIAAFLNDKYGYQAIKIEFEESYLNMSPIIEKNYHIVENVIARMKELDIKPKIIPTRGGTDGALLSHMGLPCPNLGTGSANFHGPYEFVSLTQMKKQVELLVRIVS